MAVQVLNKEDVIKALGGSRIAAGLIDSYEGVLRSIDPYSLVKKHVKVNGYQLIVDGETLKLDDFNEIYVVGTGKATYRMAVAVEELLGNRITYGVISIPRTQEASGLRVISAIGAGHPLPDAGSIEAARQMLSLRPSARCLVIALISGGGSALLELPEDEITLEDLVKTNDALLRSGATITEVNCIRKAISRVKGGKLLEHFKPCRVIQLTISDVIGDDLSSVASGPFFPGLCSKEQVEEIVKRYGLLEVLPERVARAVIGYAPPRVGQGTKATYHVLANNAFALRKLREELEARGFKVAAEISLTNEVESVAIKAVNEVKALSTGQALVGGGEATVKVRGRGKGGRTLHLAALLMLWLGKESGVYGISATTDGMDGNTDAAGCLFSTDLNREQLKESLENYDTYSEFLRLGTIIRTGYTGTNVNDLLAIVKG